MSNINKMFINYIQGRKAALFHPKREVILTRAVPGTLDTGDILIEYPVETKDTVCVLKVSGGYAVGTTVQLPISRYNRKEGNNQAFVNALEATVNGDIVALRQLPAKIVDQLGNVPKKYNTFTLYGRQGQSFKKSLGWFKNICRDLKR